MTKSKNTGRVSYATPEESFHARYVPEPMTGCWLWTSAASKGYGNIWVGLKNVVATHFSLLLVGRSVPRGMCVMHKCDTPLCVNPDHLQVGTLAENNADMFAKGRARCGQYKRKPRAARSSQASAGGES